MISTISGQNPDQTRCEKELPAQTLPHRPVGRRVHGRVGVGGGRSEDALRRQRVVCQRRRGMAAAAAALSAGGVAVGPRAEGGVRDGPRAGAVREGSGAELGRGFSFLPLLWKI